MKISTIKITSNGAVTLPTQIRKGLGLKVGDFVNAELKNGQVVLRPAKIIDAEDAFFYTKEWQKAEAEVDQEIVKDDLVGPFNNADDALEALKKDKI